MTVYLLDNEKRYIIDTGNPSFWMSTITRPTFRDLSIIKEALSTKHEYNGMLCNHIEERASLKDLEWCDRNWYRYNHSFSKIVECFDDINPMEVA